MRRLRVMTAACGIAGLAIALSAAQAPTPAPAQGATAAPAAGQGGEGARQGGGGRRGGGGGARGGGGLPADAPQPNPGNGGLTGGTILPKKADARGWGWQVKNSISPTTSRPLWNKAKELLLQDQAVTSFTIGSFNPDQYCEVQKHFDYIWFEMQHSTLTWDEVRRMILTCPPTPTTAAPMIRMPDAQEANMQKATDLGAIGIIVPTVDDALEARDAARYARYPPVGRRSAGGGSFNQVWNGASAGTYRQTVNDNMLVTVMIETLEGVAFAEEIAATAGVDVVILGNNDLTNFSGWSQTDPRYQDAIIKVHDAALKYGKFYGNAGAAYHPSANSFTVSADTRFVQNGPARDGWTPPARGAAPPAAGARGGQAPAGGRGGNFEPDPEPVLGLPGGAPGRGGRGQ